MPIKTLNEKFVHELGDIYDAEHRFRESMQKMAKEASTSELKQMLEKHIGETDDQIKNLEEVFKLMGEKAERVKCDGAAGLVSEAEKGLKEAKGAPDIVDLLILASTSKAEHYEISSYHGLIVGAEQMGQKEVAELFKANLEQEEKTSKLVEKTIPKRLKEAMQAEAEGQ
ncbi:MAG TPA: DUF892 family protein [Herpetosiphonaceae bacterium]|nr:DUF892 family protein [Herpetosiphonaceae bacterium]